MLKNSAFFTFIFVGVRIFFYVEIVLLYLIANFIVPSQYLQYADSTIFRRRYAIGQFVDESGDVISHLNISNVRVEDGGLYSCRAVNSLGSAEHSARLNIYGNVLFMTVEYSNP